MSTSTTVTVIVALDAAVLGALAYVCRMPFRLGAERAELRTTSRPQHAHRSPLTEAVRQPPR
jgi:hypothetical protein